MRAIGSKPTGQMKPHSNIMRCFILKESNNFRTNAETLILYAKWTKTFQSLVINSAQCFSHCLWIQWYFQRSVNTCSVLDLLPYQKLRNV